MIVINNVTILVIVEDMNCHLKRIIFIGKKLSVNGKKCRKRSQNLQRYESHPQLPQVLLNVRIGPFTHISTYSEHFLTLVTKLCLLYKHTTDNDCSKYKPNNNET